mgnify:CR=1 FL=1
MGIRKHCFISLFLFIVQTVTAQINYGTTGLMNLPTADMQRDKTFMAGGNWLNHHATVPRWWYDTWNYYINITIFPWLEAGYLCTGHKAITPAIGCHLRMASSPIRTVLFIFAYGCGRKVGGNHGHLKW